MPRHPFKKQIQTQALSSVYGKIEQLLLAYPGKKANVTKELILERYGKLFEAFSDRVTFVVMGHFGDGTAEQNAARQAFNDAIQESNLNPGQQLILCHTPLAGGRNVDVLDVHSEFIQDPFLVMETSEGATVLLEPMHQENQENEKIAEQLCARAGYLMQPCEIQIEGGNILIGDDYALVGENIFHRNLNFGKSLDAENPRNGITLYLKKLLGVDYLIWVGNEKPTDLLPFHSTGKEGQQPFFHLDHFLTLAGKTKEGKEILLLGEIDSNFVHEATKQESEWLDKINQLLEEVRSDLEINPTKAARPAFVIVRAKMGGKITDSNKARRFVPYAYNNAHVEWYHGIRRAYLPSYPKMKTLEDSLQKELIRAAGFKSVVFIKNAFESYAANDGSLHCMSAVLARKSY